MATFDKDKIVTPDDVISIPQMDLIDRQDFIRILNKNKVPFNATINDILISMPRIGAESVVRCKYCKWHSESGYCCDTGQYTSDEDYCYDYIYSYRKVAQHGFDR